MPDTMTMDEVFKLFEATFKSFEKRMVDRIVKDAKEEIAKDVEHMVIGRLTLGLNDIYRKYK